MSIDNVELQSPSWTGLEQLRKFGIKAPVFVKSGKVREVWEWDDHILLIATDRVSAFDVIMPTLIPGKGQILTDISNKWFDFFHQIPNHKRHVPNILFSHFRGDLMKCTTPGCKTTVIPIEFIVRGYAAGSFWKDYTSKLEKRERVNEMAWERGPRPMAGTRLDAAGVDMHGIQMPSALKQCEELPEPVFTPSTKAPAGEHDKNISFDESVGICAKSVGLTGAAALQLMKALRGLSIRMYNEARCYALTKGIIVADTKFEFGFLGDTVVLIDELLTPDSSRFWDLKSYDIGRDQDSLDKQILRNYLETLVSEGTWDKSSPGPELPDDLVRKILDRYCEVQRRLWPVV